MRRIQSRLALALPFAWIGFVGSWLLAEQWGVSSQVTDGGPNRIQLVLVTPMVAGAFGWLLASPRAGGFLRYLVFVIGTPVAGAVNGIVLAAVVTATPWLQRLGGTTVYRRPLGSFSEMVVGGVLLGGGCGIGYLPALVSVLLAHARSRRGRERTLVHASDRRAIAVVAAGAGALAIWLGVDGTHSSLVSRAILASAFTVGLFGLFMDGLAFARLRSETRDVRGSVPLEGGGMATSAVRVLDFGLGDAIAQVLLPSTAAYRDAPRRAILVRGRPDRAHRALLFAVALDVVIAVAGASFLLAPRVDAAAAATTPLDASAPQNL